MAGDVILTHGTSLADRAIRWAEARRYGRDSEEARWNHAALAVDTHTVIEATAQGVVRTSLCDLHDERTTITPHYPQGGALRATAAAWRRVGEHYGWITDASIALAYMTQTRLRFGVKGAPICSGLVSLCLAEGGLEMGDDPEWNSPADLWHALREIAA